ncbi:hypothetical protein QBC32DRAFT_90310 [Pseudoneurospora amorphoporcata]|uniref:Uncharacterized protein n=1 Tax=Pseudoneurospora amorphoporcata TaxID=241081 RepID=A0AAN6NYD0_9PEZI|nr:hypothetical protein QBC32DRAFT_90310 [Pseudoneurospora amorphoporcata]
MVLVFLANLHLNPPLVFLYSVYLSVVSPIEVRLSKVGTGTPIPSMPLMYMILRTLAFFLSCISFIRAICTSTHNRPAECGAAGASRGLALPDCELIQITREHVRTVTILSCRCSGCPIVHPCRTPEFKENVFSDCSKCLFVLLLNSITRYNLAKCKGTRTIVVLEFLVFFCAFYTPSAGTLT